MAEVMTSKERLLCALEGGKPDRMPTSLHQWQGYHLDKYLGGMTDIEAWDGPLVGECRAIFDAANPDVEVISPTDILEGEEQWFNPIMAYCRWLRLFAMVAGEAGADLTQDSFAAAADDRAIPGAVDSICRWKTT